MNKLARLLEKNKAEAPVAYETIYGAEIEKRIRKRYSLSAELAILRQRDDKPEEFAEYYAFVEQCKTEVRQQMEV